MIQSVRKGWKAVVLSLFISLFVVFFGFGLSVEVLGEESTQVWESSAAAIPAPNGLPIGTPAMEKEIVRKWSYVQGAQSPYVDEKDIGQMLDDTFSDNWTTATRDVRVSRQKIDDTSVLQLNLRDSFEGNELKLTYEEPFTLSEYDVLSFLVHIGTDDPDYVGYYRVTVEMSLGDHASGSQKMVAEAWAASNLWQRIIVDAWGMDAIESMTVTVSCEDGVTPKMVRVASLHLGYDDSYAFVERYQTQSFFLSGGRLIEGEDGISLFPVGSTTHLEGEFVLGEFPKNGTQAFMFVTLSGEISGGSMTMAYTSAKNGALVYADNDPFPLRNGRYVYAFPFVASDDMLSYRLSFRNMEYSGEGVRVESVEVKFTEDIPPQATGYGYISGISLNRENGRLTIEGSVSQSVMTEHKKDELVVYAVPFTSFSRIENGSLVWEGTELLRSKIFMNFELVLDAELSSRYMGTHMFYVAVEGEGHEPILISQPRSVDHPVHTVEENSVVGIEGASAVGTFESNASHVVVDIPFSRFVLRVVQPDGGNTDEDAGILPTDTLKVSSPDGTLIFLDASVIDEILAEIGFYNSANLEVYLRITEENAPFFENISRLDAWDMEVYSAILSAILLREPVLMKEAVSGVILGDSLAYEEGTFRSYNGRSTAEAVYAYSARLSALMSVTYSSFFFSLGTSRVAVVIPYLMGGTFNEIVNQMVSYHCARMGGLPWYVMYAFSSQEDYDAVLDHGEFLTAVSRTFGVDSQALGSLYFYIPDETHSASDITFAYNSFLEAVQEINPRAVFLSVRGLLDERKEQTYRQLKNIRKEEKNSMIETIEGQYGTLNGSDEQAYTVWDFRNLYHNDGWVSGGAVAGCGTGRSEIFSRYSGISQRALRTEVYSNYENSMASAIVLRNFHQAIDLDGVDYLVFNFSIAETEEKSNLIFVMGNERIRAEYPLTDVEAGKVHTVRCPVSAFSGKGEVAYIGVMVYSGESAVLEIQSVKLQSASLSPNEMEQMMNPAPSDVVVKSSVWVYAVGIFAVITVFAAVMLIRRDREDAEFKKKDGST